MAETLEVSPDLQAELEDLIPAGNRVVVCIRYLGRGDRSGVPIDLRETHVMAVRDDEVVEADSCTTLGLSRVSR